MTTHRGQQGYSLIELLIAMAVITVVLLSIHRHYVAIGRQLRQRVVPVRATAENHVVLLVPDLEAATAEALGWVRASPLKKCPDRAAA